MAHAPATTPPSTRGPARPADDDGPADVPLTSFVGRTTEIAAVLQLARDVRLVSLIGPGGSGKTRLAHTVRTQLDSAGSERVWWVSLAHVDRPAMLAAVAEALDVTEVAGRPLMHVVIAHLRGNPGIVVLDNCEHLIDAAADLVGVLLRACPGLRVLSTSREPLAVAGEATWRVAGLSLPDEGAAFDVAGLWSSEAVQLFVDRARLVDPRFQLTRDNAADVARLCGRLDGMPLALELAAARLRVLPLTQIVARLDDAVPLLSTTNRGVPPRQITMRATLDWSYGLLDPQERRMLAELSSFRGGFTLAAAEAVTRLGADTLDLLARLVDKSLVQVRADRDEERYRLLEVVRQYAEEKLGDRRSEIAARHARHMVELAERAEQELVGSAQHQWLARVHTEQDNMRGALAWAQRHDPGTALSLAGALGRYWRLRGHYAEARQWLRAAVDACDGAVAAPTPALARALTALGQFEFLQCEYGEAAARLHKAADLCTAAGDIRGLVAVRQTLGSIAREQGRYAEARHHHEACLTLWRSLDEPAGIARAIKALGFTAWLDGRFDEAVELSGDALARFRALGDSEGSVGAMIDLATANAHLGNSGRARELLRDSLAVAEEHQFREAIAWATEQLGLIAARSGERGEAVRLLRAGLAIHHDLGDRWRTSSVLEALSGVVTDPATGVQMLTAAAILRRAIGAPVPPADAADQAERTRRLRASVTDDEWEQATTTGAALSADAAVGLALGASTDGRPAAGPVATTDSPALRVEALGKAAVKVAGRPLDPRDFGYAKPRELLFFLISRPGSTKAEIGLALWPDASDSELRNGFHTCLKFLRRAMGASARVPFVDGGYRIAAAADLRYDVDEFGTAFRAARAAGEGPDALPSLTTAADLYTGDFLLDVAAGPWTEPIRSELRSRYERILLNLGTLLGRQRRFEDAADAFARLIAHDPLLEAGHRGLMRCHAALGDRGRALRTYHDLAGLLHDQMNAAPAAETTALYHHLRQEASARPTPAG